MFSYSQHNESSSRSERMKDKTNEVGLNECENEQSECESTQQSTYPRKASKYTQILYSQTNQDLWIQKKRNLFRSHRKQLSKQLYTLASLVLMLSH